MRGYQGLGGTVGLGTVVYALAIGQLLLCTDRGTALAPELCVAIGSPALDLAGAASFIKIGGGGKHADGAIGGLAGPALAELIRTLEDA